MRVGRGKDVTLSIVVRMAPGFDSRARHEKAQGCAGRGLKKGK